jgi:hypothetical protein
MYCEGLKKIEFHQQLVSSLPSFFAILASLVGVLRPRQYVNAPIKYPNYIILYYKLFSKCPSPFNSNPSIESVTDILYLPLVHESSCSPAWIPTPPPPWSPPTSSSWPTPRACIEQGSDAAGPPMNYWKQKRRFSSCKKRTGNYVELLGLFSCH